MFGTAADRRAVATGLRGLGNLGFGIWYLPFHNGNALTCSGQLRSFCGQVGGWRWRAKTSFFPTWWNSTRFFRIAPDVTVNPARTSFSTNQRASQGRPSNPGSRFCAQGTILLSQMSQSSQIGQKQNPPRLPHLYNNIFNLLPALLASSGAGTELRLLGVERKQGRRRPVRPARSWPDVWHRRREVKVRTVACS
jgi:hypothetical protein